MGYVILYNPGERDRFSSNDVEEPCENIGWIVHALELESCENLAEMALHLVSIGAVCYINILYYAKFLRRQSTESKVSSPIMKNLAISNPHSQ